jgi:uncharacterized protein (TIGR02421 family)
VTAVLTAVTDLHHIDRALCRLGSTILPLRHLDPINSEEEQAKFLASKSYNPQFRYLPIPEQDYQRMSAELDALMPDESPIGRLFEHTRNYLRRRLRLRRVLGTAEFWDPDLYGRPSQDLIQLAERILKDERRLAMHEASDEIYGADFVVNLMEQALRRYGLHEWTVLARPSISATNVESANRVINVRSDARYSMITAKRLIVHEVETHVLRAANGYRQPFGIFGAALIPGYLATEEGLALVNEERAGYIDHPRLRVLAARVIASHLSRLNSFRQIYDELLAYDLDPEETWITVKRVKRGLGNTVHPGGYIKDHVYLWGKIKLEQFIVEGGELASLYVGKIGLDHLDIINKIGLNAPKYLPSTYGHRSPGL